MSRHRGRHRRSHTPRPAQRGGAQHPRAPGAAQRRPASLHAAHCGRVAAARRRQHRVAHDLHTRRLSGAANHRPARLHTGCVDDRVRAERDAALAGARHARLCRATRPQAHRGQAAVRHRGVRRRLAARLRQDGHAHARPDARRRARRRHGAPRGAAHAPTLQAPSGHHGRCQTNGI